MLVSVLSLKGSPGVTTFAAALAACWPRPSRGLLLEADPSGGDLAVRLGVPAGLGVVGVAAAVRHGCDAEALWRHSRPLPGGWGVVVTPPDADQAGGALSALGDGIDVVRRAADERGTVVVVDCGRVDERSPAMALVRRSDVVVLLTRAYAEDLAHLLNRLDAVGRWGRRAVLLLAGPGYSAAEVAWTLGVAPLGRVPWDRVGAAVLCGRSGVGQRVEPARSALGRFAHKVAAELSAHLSAVESVPVAAVAGAQGEGRLAP
ncbi:P-loop NTPase family protein [Saccharothrix variisporea]|uniref:MinD-like ATPase involved in chromosome partitioning or flagellar assembly n=1 Tax=Saccharothrix variisporea TaxID=543527 RepID=A0A495X8J1_9PSEU|nr:chromosome partitioning protein [Saccharothrix variisporea]RKT69475.1 MinD-like ATPase involved in chromosome partitioning or flagellar assembly [Saccharothrix variisporea]